MSTITKEQAKDLRNAFECWRQDYDPVEDKEQYDMFGLGMVAMDALLASLEAEAAYFINRVKHSDAFGDDVELRTYCYELDALKSKEDFGGEIVPVYTAMPAPVSVPDEKVKGDDFELDGPLSCYQAGKIDGWNECRDAMLQGAEPVTTAYKLPDDFDFDRFNDVVWLEAVASNPHMHSLTTSTIAMVALELNRKLANGNSPVSPDGWVACSERMPQVGVKVLCFPVNDEPIHATYNGQLWLQDISWSTSDEPIDNVISCNVFHWMPLPAAPKQEAKNV